jgi:hypothetical protein
MTISRYATYLLCTVSVKDSRSNSVAGGFDNCRKPLAGSRLTMFEQRTTFQTD